MSDQRLHAFDVLLRVAQVREMGASAELTEACMEEEKRRDERTSVAAACDAVAAANRACAADRASVDMARFELLSHLNTALAKQLDTASRELELAQERRQERAHACVMAKRQREQIDERRSKRHKALDEKRAAGMQEEAIELWLGGKAR